MTLTVYDKAKWHASAESCPADLPFECSATHIAFFFRWCIENRLCSQKIEEEYKEDMHAIRVGAKDCRTFFVNEFDGVLTSEELSPEGKAFADAYYTESTTDFAQKHGWYLNDYGTFADAVFARTNEHKLYYFIANNQAHYDEIKTCCDARYAAFTETQV